MNYSAITVYFDRDLPEEEVRNLKAAFEQFKHVIKASAEPYDRSYHAEARAKTELRRKINELLR
jgi:hypothetical protein